MAKFDLKEFTGVIPAMVTPFDENEALDEARLAAIVEHLVGRGVDGLYLTGSTGEGFMMTPEERKRVVEISCKIVAGRIPVMVHVGAISTKVSIDLAQHAESCGADAISSVPPFYWNFSPDQVFNYYRDITASTGLPMVVYNVPLIQGMGFDLIKRLATIEGVKGIKYTATTHFDILRIKQEVGQEFIVYSGADEMAISGLAFGADGIIGSFYNIVPELFQEIFAAVKAGDLTRAKALQEQGNAVIFFGLAHKGVAMIKRAMAWMGADAGYVRRPFDNLSAQEEELARTEFTALLRKIRLEGLPNVS